MSKSFFRSIVWEKVKAAASNLADTVRQSTQKVIEQYKPQILAALDNVKKVVIKGAKNLLIEVVNGIVKIIADGDSATSDGKVHAEFSNAFSIYEVVESPYLEINIFTDGKFKY